MICTYQTKIVAACPVDQKPDVYEATFISDDTIRCEDILAAIGKYASEKAYQEAITAALARDLRCRVITVGYHSGVKTTVEAP
jgi:uncharacterized membrane protein YkvA (DUF1232 family)